MMEAEGKDGPVRELLAIFGDGPGCLGQRMRAKYAKDPAMLLAWQDIRQEAFLGCQRAVRKANWRGVYGVGSLRALAEKIVKRQFASHYAAEREENLWRVNPFQTMESKSAARKAALTDSNRQGGEATTGWTKAPGQEPDLETALRIEIAKEAKLRRSCDERGEAGAGAFDPNEHRDFARVPFGLEPTRGFSNGDAPTTSSPHPLDAYNAKTTTRFWGMVSREALTPFAEDRPGDDGLTRWKLGLAYWMDPLERVTTDELREKIKRSVPFRHFVGYAMALMADEQGYMRSEFDCLDTSGQRLASHQKRYALDSFRRFFREELGPALGLIKEQKPRSFSSKSLAMLYDPIRQNPNYARECIPRHISFGDLGTAEPDREKRYQRPSLILKRHAGLLKASRSIQEREARNYPACAKCGQRRRANLCQTINGLAYCLDCWPKLSPLWTEPPAWVANYLKKYGSDFVKNSTYRDYTL